MVYLLWYFEKNTLCRLQHLERYINKDEDGDSLAQSAMVGKSMNVWWDERTRIIQWENRFTPGASLLLS
jgi:hypothetical protein